MDAKRQLYYLLENVKKGKYDINTFCNLFTVTFNVECDYESLSKTELNVFSELEQYTSRFSPFAEDLKKYPNTYYNEETIKEQIDIALAKLENDIHFE